MPSDRVHWLFVDLNSYFASVEQQQNPKLRGKPVAVVPMMAETTSCLAASVEAKRFGIKTGTRVADARKLCPEIVFIDAAHEKYVEYHHKIVEAVESCVPVTAVLSIDEMACRLMGRETELENALALGRQIKKRILSHAGDYLRSSIGLAPNRFLAKVASDMQKPDGLVSILPKDLPEKILPLALRDFPGIGPKMEKRFLLYGVGDTPGLFRLTKEEMRQVFGGINGEYFWSWIRGEETSERETSRSVIGNSHVLPPDLREREKACLVAQKLLHKAAARMRREEYWCTRLDLHVQYTDRDSFSEHKKLLECSDDITLLEAFHELWRQSPRFGKPLKVAVALSGLITDAHHTLSLFRNPRRENLSAALDSINVRYGKDTVYFASLQGMKAAAPTRIAFSNIPDFEV